MNNTEKPSDQPDLTVNKNEKVDFPGYPLYPAEDDIFNRSKEMWKIDPEDISKQKIYEKGDVKNASNEKDFTDSETGEDLDIPGSELDDEQEEKGSEDEENNYYSLGGDNHNDLDEDRGEILP